MEPLPPPDAEPANDAAPPPRPALQAYRKPATSLLGSPWLLRAVIAVAVAATLVVILKPRATRDPPQVAGIPSAQASTQSQQESMATGMLVQPATPGAGQAPLGDATAAPAVAPPGSR